MPGAHELCAFLDRSGLPRCVTHLAKRPTCVCCRCAGQGAVASEHCHTMSASITLSCAPVMFPHICVLKSKRKTLRKDICVKKRNESPPNDATELLTDTHQRHMCVCVCVQLPPRAGASSHATCGTVCTTSTSSWGCSPSSPPSPGSASSRTSKSRAVTVRVAAEQPP